MMKEFFLSLLYPDRASKEYHENEKNRPYVSAETVRELGLDKIIALENADLCDFFTAERTVMDYRREVLLDMQSVAGLSDALTSVFPILRDIVELRRMSENEDENTEDYLLALCEIELYTSTIKTLREKLAPIENLLTARATKSLAAKIKELAESDYYKELNEKLDALTSRVKDIKSVTIGINLDSALRPQSAGVLSINPTSFKSGDVIEKILRMSFAKDENTLIAPLIPFAKSQNENEKVAMSYAMMSAVNHVFRSSVRMWKKIVQTYVLDNTEFLIDLMPEIEFYIRAAEFAGRLKEKNLPLCTPEILPYGKKAYSAKGLYNPVVSLSDSASVSNDIDFDDKGKIFVLTGPNRGGKSVFTCAVGISAALTALGIGACADSFSMSPVDAVFTHFPTGADDTAGKGRLGEECARMVKIFERVSENSLVLLDETFSSTGSYEAAYIATEVLTALSRCKTRAVFSTHLHELAAKIDGINSDAEKCGGVKVDTLIAEMADGERTFRILRMADDGKSYARDIAEKYGLSLDKITEKINHKNG